MSEALTETLRKHALWLEDDDDGERADLRYADLRYVNLSDADLSDADLRYVNLSDANLRYADLRGADLRYANLCGTAGNLREIKSLFLGTWPITYTAKYMQIGCERHLISDWFEFDDERISRMDSYALDFWSKWRDYIKQTIEMSPATPTGKEDTTEEAALVALGEGNDG